MLVLWLTTGVIYGAIHENWTFIRSLYFSVAALSTAGLQAPVAGDFSLFLVGCYSLTGVPIFGACLGALASFIVDRSVEMKQKNQVHAVKQAYMLWWRDEAVLH